jgi:hypothetical protein
VIEAGGWPHREVILPNVYRAALRNLDAKIVSVGIPVNSYPRLRFSLCIIDDTSDV